MYTRLLSFLILINFSSAFATASSSSMLDEDKKAATPHQTYETIIIGGGLAGLTAGYQLTKAGKQVHIIEARDCLGGRAKTFYFPDGTYAELGGEVIDEDHNDIRELATELGVELSAKPLFQKISFMKTGIQDEISLHTLLQAFKVLQQKINLNERSLPFSTMLTLKEVLKEYISDPSICEVISLVIRDEFGRDLSDMGILGIFAVKNMLDKYIPYLEMLKENSEDLEQCNEYIVKGGNITLIKALEAKIGSANITTRQILKRLSRNNAGFHLEVTNPGFSQNISLQARNVILTIPFSAMRQGQVQLDDSLKLSSFTKQAIEKLPYGMNSKVIYQIAKSPFTAQTYYGGHCEAGFTCWSPGYQQPQNITCMVGGINAKSAFSTPTTLKSQSQKSFLGAVQSLNVQVISDPTVYSWSLDAFAKGSYSIHDYKLASSELYEESKLYPSMRKFAEPTSKGLYFIGEHTQNVSGYLNSAVCSGIEVAGIILRE